MFSLARKESVACSTEALEDLNVHLLWCEANGLPFCLDVNNLLGMLLPVCSILIFFVADSLYVLTECSLLCEVLLFTSTQVVEMLLMALVDDC